MRVAPLALFLAACGHSTTPLAPAPPASQVAPTSTAPSPPTPPAPTTAASTRVVERAPPRHASDDEGLYVSTHGSRLRMCTLVDHEKGTWLACLGGDLGLVAVARAGGHLKPSSAGAPPIALTRPTERGRPWSLREGQGPTLEQRRDPFFTSIEERLTGLTFTRLDASIYASTKRVADSLGSERITMKDGLVATMELEKHECRLGMLFPDPTWNNSIPLTTPAPPPPPGKLAVRTFLLLDLGEECVPVLDPTKRHASHSGAAGARLYADSTGEPVGIVLVGYMYGELFVAPDRSPVEIAQLIDAVRQEVGHQAE